MEPTVNLFITCLVDTLHPDIGEAVVKVLNRAGYRVHLPEGQTCCGQPASNAGLRDEARQIARYTISLLEKTEGWIVIPSGSCAGMVIHGYHEIFSDDPEWLARAESVANRTKELTQFLVEVARCTQFGAAYDGTITYHPSCHLARDLGVTEEPLRLLEKISGATLTELPFADECCGFGGLFSIEHPEIAGEMVERKVQNYRATNAPILVTCDAGCLTNIQGRLKKKKLPGRVVHIAQVLANQVGD